MSGKQKKSRQSENSVQSLAQHEKLSSLLDANISRMKKRFCEANDFVVREFELNCFSKRRAALFFIDGLVSLAAINESVLRPLMFESRTLAGREDALESINELTSLLLTAGDVKTADSIDDAVSACLAGDTVLMVEELNELAYISTKGYEKRSVSEPQTETVVRGPREGFTEVLRVNTSLLRRRLKTPDLRLELMQLGRRTNTAVCLAYIDGIANPQLVAELRKRFNTIDTDAILNSGYIEEFIEDAPNSLFQTVNFSEKPDVVTSKLLEGRCALIIDGTPFVLTMPMLFVECFQSPEDYAARPYIAAFLRVIRVIAFFLSLTSPAMYIALTLYHQELIPTKLSFTIAASSEGVPFNSVIETAIMLATFEILKEAGVRLPKPIGQAISIVGALVMGQAVIQAGIAGAPVVIVVAFTAVAGFLVPNLSDSISILRWYLLILAAVMGGFGITIGLMTILIHLASIESFGSVYLYPFSPFNSDGLKDAVFRTPLWNMRMRPAVFKPMDRVRQNMKRPRFGRNGGEDAES